MGFFGSGNKKEKKGSGSPVPYKGKPVNEKKVLKMTDQNMLLGAALDERNSSDVRMTAAKKLDDEHLAEFLIRKSGASATGYLSSEISDLGDELVTRIDGDQQALYRLAMCNDYLFNRAAVEKLTDQGLLTRIARIHPKSQGRKAAVKKLSDQRILGEIALNDEDQWVRKEALSRTDSQEIIAKVALTDTQLDVRGDAIERLTDPIVLKKVALTDKYEYNAAKAAERIDDQSILKEIVRTSQIPLARSNAAEKIEDQDLLKEIAENDKSREVRNAAVRHIKDQAFLRSVIENDDSDSVRQMAARFMLDVSYLRELAGNDDASCDLREEAAKRMLNIGTEADKADAEQLLEQIQQKRDADDQKDREYYNSYVKGENLA